MSIFPNSAPFPKEDIISKTPSRGILNFAVLFFLHWVVQSKTDLDTLDHYLDDFIFAGANGSGNCALLMDAFKSICQELGVPLADKFLMIFKYDLANNILH
jgi:hypothetical protein